MGLSLPESFILKIDIPIRRLKLSNFDICTNQVDTSTLRFNTQMDERIESFMQRWPVEDLEVKQFCFDEQFDPLYNSKKEEAEQEDDKKDDKYFSRNEVKCLIIGLYLMSELHHKFHLNLKNLPNL